jgi:hypothetical protein
LRGQVIRKTKLRAIRQAISAASGILLVRQLRSAGGASPGRRGGSLAMRFRVHVYFGLCAFFR